MPDIAVEWIYADDMTDEEKQEHPTHETTGGYLKATDQRDSRQEWWDGLTQDDKDEVMSLPNFDAEIFEKCTGIETVLTTGEE